MTDRELLELAAKAAGLKLIWGQLDPTTPILDQNKRAERWNPIADDGDALRLAVKLKLGVFLRPNRVEIIEWPDLSNTLLGLEPLPPTRILSTEAYNDDPYAATRRAIVRAAAEIGKGMK